MTLPPTSQPVQAVGYKYATERSIVSVRRDFDSP